MHGNKMWWITVMLSQLMAGSWNRRWCWKPAINVPGVHIKA